jgi:probable addiction module antidote protein
MKTETKPYDPLKFFINEDEIAAYLNDAFNDDDPDMFIIALGHVAKRKGIAKIAADTGLNRESLYKALSGKSRPKWDTIQRIIKALNVNIRLAT